MPDTDKDSQDKQDKRITFEQWFERFFPIDERESFTLEDLRATWNASRTEARPRIWRYKREGGTWKIEYGEL